MCVCLAFKIMYAFTKLNIIAGTEKTDTPFVARCSELAIAIMSHNDDVHANLPHAPCTHHWILDAESVLSSRPMVTMSQCTASPIADSRGFQDAKNGGNMFKYFKILNG